MAPLPTSARAVVRRGASVLALLAVLLSGPAQADDTERALRRLVTRLPAYGRIVDFTDLGITVGTLENPPPPVKDGFNFLFPANIDRASTTDPPYRGRFPQLFLNQPLHAEGGDISYLFMSDQPEEAREDRVREDGTKGATGVYARAPIPRAAPIRVLLDHTNGTSRPLHLLLLFLPRDTGTLHVGPRGQAVHLDSVRAGHEAFLSVRQVLPSERTALTRDKAVPIVDLVLAPRQTGVVHLRMSATVPGVLAALLIDADAPVPRTLTDLDRLPTLHSIVWREEAGRLSRFIDPNLQPTRYRRILDSFQHARGVFAHPDRVARVRYDAAGWQARDVPVRAYSIFESIPGVDPTPGTRDPRDPSAAIAAVDNRGKYGGVEELRIRIGRLPTGCHRVAVLVLNPNPTYGGRHYVTDGRRHARETWFLPRFASPPRLGPISDALPLLERGKAALLWTGEVAPGDDLRLWTEPMANTSVYLWYLVVPLPSDAPADPGTGARR